MSVGAMMVGARQAGTTVNLITASPWTVPAGVTAVTVFAARPGGFAGDDTVPGGRGGGGGGGASITGCVVAVTPGDVLDLTFPLDRQVQLNLNGAFVARLEAGVNASALTVAGGAGGSALWGATAANGGGAGTTAGAAGSTGDVAFVAGGVIAGGGGGGAGSTTSGGAGGAGQVPGQAATGVYGGGGGGVIPGQSRLSPASATATDNGFVEVRY